jgi:hypothetical protein
MKSVTIREALRRSNLKERNYILVGKRVAQSWKTAYPDQSLPTKQEGEFEVKVYPKWFKSKILKIARKLMRQEGKTLKFEKRKRKKDLTKSFSV